MKLIYACLALLLWLGGTASARGAEEKQPLKEIHYPPKKLVVLAPPVLHTVTTEGDGGNMISEWLAQNGVKGIDWQTPDSPGEVADRLFREARGPTGTVDVALILNNALSPQMAELLSPLDEYLVQAPLEDDRAVFPQLKKAAELGRLTYGIPFGQVTSTLHYNAMDYQDRGIGDPPRHMEDLAASIPKLTFIRRDGTKAFGFVLPGRGRIQVGYTDLARAWNGDFISTDYRYQANGFGMVQAITLLRNLYRQGYYPEAFTTLDDTARNSWMRQGRGVMTFSPAEYYRQYNDEEGSKGPARFKTAPIPVARDLAGKFSIAPATTEVWCLVIPGNAEHKHFSWRFIQHLSSRESTLRAALNGNGSVHAFTYENKIFRARARYWQAERDALRVARLLMPAFKDTAEAADLLREYSEAAILGRMEVQEAMDRLAREVEALLPKQKR